MTQRPWRLRLRSSRPVSSELSLAPKGQLSTGQCTYRQSHPPLQFCWLRLLPNLLYIPKWRGSKETAVFAGELGAADIANVIRRSRRIHRLDQHEPPSFLQTKLLLILMGVILVSVLKWWWSPEGLMFPSWAISFIENGLSKFSFNQLTAFTTPLALPSACDIRSSCSPCSLRHKR
jgi:hypothetical protein